MVLITDVIFTEGFPTCITLQRKEIWAKNKEERLSGSRATAAGVLTTDTNKRKYILSSHNPVVFREITKVISKSKEVQASTASSPLFIHSTGQHRPQVPQELFKCQSLRH